MNGTIVKPATYKQLKWLRDLLEGRDFSNFPTDWLNYCTYIREAFVRAAGDGTEAGLLNEWLEKTGRDTVSQDTFRTLLPKLQEAKRIETEKPKAEPAQNISQVVEVEDGVYYVGGTIFKVKKTKAGRQWAHKLVVLGEASKGGHVAAKFVYAGGVAKNGITPEAKLTYEKAQEFGALYGICCCCGRLLTNELSVYLGIGPVCGGREFGGEFKFIIDQAKLAIGEAK